MYVQRQQRGAEILGLVNKTLMAVLVAVWPAAITAAEQLKLADISAYLNGISTLKAPFEQINDDGSVSTGTLYIRRPGRMRFEYDPPEDALVIAAASAVVIFDGKSNQGSETYPLRKTPLSLILARNIDLTRARMVRDARFDGVATTVTAYNPDEPDVGFIELTFTDNPTQLRHWVVTDSGGGRTKVALGAFETGLDLPESLFDAEREKRQR